MLSGQGISYYFYGQNYGLSIFESLAVAGCIPFFGNTFWSLKFGALLIFTLGLTFLYKSIKDKSSSRMLNIFLMLLLSTFPTWYLWGSMSRGGYVTAFAAACIIYYLSQKQNTRTWVTIALAILLFITYDAHSFLILPVLPFLMIWWLKKEDKIKSGILFGSITLGLMLFIPWAMSQSQLSDRIPLEFANLSWKNLSLHLSSWDHGFSGYFYFFADIEPPKYWLIGLFSVAILFLLSIVYLSYRGFKTHWKLILFCVLSFGLGLVVLSTIDKNTPRYMIGIYTIFLFLFVFLVTHVKSKLKLIIVSVLIAFSIIGVTAGSKISRHWIEGENFAESMNTTYEYAKKNKIKAVFSLNHQFTWNYLYGDEIPATNLCWRNRTNEFSEKVKNQFNSVPSSVMLIGMPNYSFGVEKTEGFEFDTTGISQSTYILRNVKEAHLINGRKNYPCYEIDQPEQFLD